MEEQWYLYKNSHRGKKSKKELVNSTLLKATFVAPQISFDKHELKFLIEIHPDQNNNVLMLEGI